jgi:hypothetical protein
MFEDDENIKGGENTKNYKEALHEYFKLKKLYEDKIRNEKIKIYKKEPNKKEFRKKVLEFKPLCIKCSRPVGSIFSSTNDTFVAICGHTTLPCGLNIKLYKGNNDNITFLLNIFKEDTSLFENAIIIQKLDALFQYKNETQSIYYFKKAIDSYNGYSVLYKELIDTYNSLYDNKDKQTLISIKKEEIYRLIDKSRSYLDEYKKTQNPEFLTLSVEVNVKEIQPAIEALRPLNNEIMEMYSENGKNDVPIHTLFTYPVLLEKIDDNNSGEPMRVIKFVV